MAGGALHGAVTKASPAHLQRGRLVKVSVQGTVLVPVRAFEKMPMLGAKIWVSLCVSWHVGMVHATTFDGKIGNAGTPPDSFGGKELLEAPDGKMTVMSTPLVPAGIGLL